MADQYQLKVSAGHDYSASSQVPVNVNSETPLHITSPTLDISLTVRVQNYRGLPPDTAQTSPYFSTPQHKSDLYSLQFSFVPREDINGHALVLGNDFDRPIRDRLPPGTDQALKITQWFIDPGLYGDVKADRPNLFGPLLSSVNAFRLDGRQPLNHGDDAPDQDVRVVQEGATEGAEAQSLRKESGIPATPAGRRKYFLNASNLTKFTFKKGLCYTCDFFNPYIDFNEFAVKLPSFGPLPGITIPVIKYWDGQPLRYVLKNRVTNQPLLVIIFTLVPRDGNDESGQQADVADSAGKTKTKSPVTARTDVKTADDDVD